ncbi:hypothetical protein [Shimia aestuarii]|uniref:hypothetical protein n=1 Tax=Shimia aestuarii TaxID=254406 RepID=UPI001FB4C139|nr:hypothetical protein [Shimia aestuarii]
MFRNLTNRTLAAVLAASIAMTGFAAAPARAADSGDAAKIAAGLAALFIIGKALEDNDRDYVHRRHGGYNPNHNRYRNPHHARKNLPAKCRFVFNTRHGRVPMMGQNCLVKNYGKINHLPNHCRINVKTKKGLMRYGYKPHCLRNNGYRLVNY